jgi:hypothetical protein
VIRRALDWPASARRVPAPRPTGSRRAGR